MNGLFCEINEGVCFTKMKKMNPEECQTECEINEMKVPSFYDLERFHNFHPPLVLLQKVEDTRVCKFNSCAFICQLTDIFPRTHPGILVQ